MCPLVCYIQARECRARFPTSNNAIVHVRQNMSLYKSEHEYKLKLKADAIAFKRGSPSTCESLEPEGHRRNMTCGNHPLFLPKEVFESSRFQGFPKKNPSVRASSHLLKYSSMTHLSQILKQLAICHRVWRNSAKKIQKKTRYEQKQYKELHVRKLWILCGHKKHKFDFFPSR